MCILGNVLEGYGDMMSGELCVEEAMDAISILQECWSCLLGQREYRYVYGCHEGKGYDALIP